jgi:hypothetical protein
VTALAGDSKMFEVGQNVKIANTEIHGVILRQSSKGFWPDLSGCFKVRVAGHGDFNIPANKLEGAENV